MHYREPIVMGIAFPSLTKFSGRRAESSRTSLRKRVHSLERFVSEAIIRVHSQYFSTADDEDDTQYSCTTMTLTFDVLKDLIQVMES